MLGEPIKYVEPDRIRREARRVVTWWLLDLPF